VAKFTTKVFSKVKSIPQPDTAAIISVPVDVDFPTVAPAANDIVELATLPPGVTLQDYSMHFPDIDSNGAPTAAWSFGVLNAGSTDLATVYATGLTAGQSNAVVRNPNTDCAQADSTVERRLGLKLTTAAATWGGAGKTGQVLLELRG
jgi:hypothetical protein